MVEKYAAAGVIWIQDSNILPQLHLNWGKMTQGRKV